MAQKSEHPGSWGPDEMSECIRHRPARGSTAVKEVDTGTSNKHRHTYVSVFVWIVWVFWSKFEKKLDRGNAICLRPGHL